MRRFAIFTKRSVHTHTHTPFYHVITNDDKQLHANWTSLEIGALCAIPLSSKKIFQDVHMSNLMRRANPNLALGASWHLPLLRSSAVFLQRFECLWSSTFSKFLSSTPWIVYAINMRVRRLTWGRNLTENREHTLLNMLVKGYHFSWHEQMRERYNKCIFILRNANRSRKRKRKKKSSLCN